MKKCTSCGVTVDDHFHSCPSCNGELEQIGSTGKKRFISIIKAWLYTEAFVAVSYVTAIIAGIVLSVIYYDPSDKDYITKVLTVDVENVITLSSYVLFGVLLTVFFCLRKKNVLREVGITKCPPSALAVSALFGISANYLYSFVVGIIPWPDGILEAHNEAYALLEGGGNIVLTVVTVALLTGVFEEVVYRGLVMTRLKGALHPAIACIISALLFSLAHPSVISAVYTAVFGLCLALIFEKYVSVVPCIVSHVCFNLMACIGYPEGDVVTLIILTASVVLHAVSIFALVMLPSAKDAYVNGAEQV